MVYEFYNANANSYDKDHLKPQSTMWYVEMRRREIILPIITERDRFILDVACGTGYYLQLLKSNNNFLVGGDISYNMLMVSQEKGAGDMLYVGQYEKIPFKDGIFDIVLCINSFHYAIMPEDALKEMKRVLKPSGKIVLSYFNLLNFRAINLTRKLFNQNAPPAQEHRYLESQFEGMVVTSGFSIISITGVNWLPYQVNGKMRRKFVLDMLEYLERKVQKSFLRHFANETIVEMVMAA